jgi:hypothetical protein
MEIIQAKMLIPLEVQEREQTLGGGNEHNEAFDCNLN